MHRMNDGFGVGNVKSVLRLVKRSPLDVVWFRSGLLCPRLLCSLLRFAPGFTLGGQVSSVLLALVLTALLVAIRAPRPFS